MKRLSAVLAVLLVVAGCSGTGGGRSGTDGGVFGTYEYAGPLPVDSSFEFKGDTLYFHHGLDDITRGDYTVDGSTVRICFETGCTDLQIQDDGCLLNESKDRFCKE